MNRRALLTVAASGLALAGCASGASQTAATAAPSAAASSLVDRAAGLVRPDAVHLDPQADPEAARTVVRTAQQLYTFWNTGDTAWLSKAVAPSFRDRTLPTGRPQGPAGPIAASKAFRAAVPDLTCELADLYVTGDTFTARLVFAGRFTGTYNGVHGTGQSIRFGAIDIQHLGAGGRITEDWHLEDNLTFLQQAGLVTIEGAK